MLQSLHVQRQQRKHFGTKSQIERLKRRVGNVSFSAVCSVISLLTDDRSAASISQKPFWCIFRVMRLKLTYEYDDGRGTVGFSQQSHALGWDGFCKLDPRTCPVEPIPKTSCI